MVRRKHVEGHRETRFKIAVCASQRELCAEPSSNINGLFCLPIAKFCGQRKPPLVRPGEVTENPNRCRTSLSQQEVPARSGRSHLYDAAHLYVIVGCIAQQYTYNELRQDHLGDPTVQVPLTGYLRLTPHASLPLNRRSVGLLFVSITTSVS